MALDLTGLRPFLNELILVDTCAVWRDPEGSTDDVTSPSGSTPVDDIVAIEVVQCKFKPIYRAFPKDSGGSPFQVGTFEMAKESNGTSWRVGDQIELLACPHHPEKVGNWYRVAEILDSSLSPFYKVRLEAWRRPDDRP